MKRLLNTLLLIVLAAASALAPQPQNWQDRVDPAALASAQTGPVEFIVTLKEQADLSGAQRLKTKADKGRYVFEQLTAVAEHTQAPLLQALQALAQSQPGAVEFRPYWVANMVWVRGDAAVIEALARRSDVAYIYANPQVRQDLPEAQPQPEADTLSPQAAEWNLAQVNAPQMWARGFTGQGAVIGGQDTGYAWEHPALKSKYRGWNGVVADHNYNWHDAIHSGVTSCGINSPFPCDDQTHGTHTMGTMVGDDGGSNQVGMAPGARWIGCRNMSEGVGSPASYAECYQWFIAPTDLNNQNPRPDLAPDVINNSWSCPPSEQCIDPNVLLGVVDAVRAAGIVTAHSAGNSGSSCGSVRDPAAIYDSSFTVGATDSLDNIVGFSSRGPVTVDGSNRLKPDVSAPGSGIRSSIPTSGYTSLSGTSMAAPHVAGLVALLISADPTLSGDVDRIEGLIRTSALPRTHSQICGSIPGSQVPNNTYGWGRIDALRALEALTASHIHFNKSAALPYYTAGEEMIYTLELSYGLPTAPITTVVISDTIPTGVNFLWATPPYSQVGNVIRWSFPNVAPGSQINLELAVQIPPSADGPLVNAVYGLRSDQAPHIAGRPVIILPRDQIFLMYVPWTIRLGRLP